MGNELFEALDKLFAASKRRNAIRAIMGDGEGNLLPTDPDGAVLPGYVWVRIQVGDEGGLSLRQVRNRVLPPVYGMPVILGYGYDKNLEVQAEDPSITPDFMAGRGTTGNHAWTHQVFGPDTLWVQAYQIMPLLAHPTYPSSTSIAIEPYSLDLPSGPVFYPGETSVALSSYIPSNAGEQRPIVVGLDTASLEAVIVAGDALTPVVPTGYAMPFTGADLVDIATDPGVLRIAGIRLYYGQTIVTWTDWIADLRQSAGNGGFAVDNSALYLAWRGNT